MIDINETLKLVNLLHILVVCFIEHFIFHNIEQTAKNHVHVGV